MKIKELIPNPRTYILEDNGFPFGGTSFRNETLWNFMLECEISPEDDLDGLNNDLRVCGIMEIDTDKAFEISQMDLKGYKKALIEYITNSYPDYDKRVISKVKSAATFNAVDEVVENFEKLYTPDAPVFLDMP